MKAIRSHLYWSATSTKQGFEELILAKWKSFVNHVKNVHENHVPYRLFNLKDTTSVTSGNLGCYD